MRRESAMRIARVLLSLGTAACGMLLPAAVASAAVPYPPGRELISVSASVVAAGDSVTLSGTHGPHDNVTIDVTTNANALRHGSGTIFPVAYVLPQRPVKVVQADENGHWSTTHTLTEVGLATITATGDRSGITRSITIRVLPKGTALPVTGTNGGLRGWALIGAALAVSGVVFVVLARSRHRRPVRMRK